MGIIAFILVGLIAGLVARAVMPGTQRMGLVPTTLLGMAGSLVGGLVGSLFYSGGERGGIHPAGILMSILGALVVLFVVSYVGRGRRVRV